MLTILYGENDYEISVRKKQIIRQYKQNTNSDIGLEQFDSEIEPGKLWQAITAQPFLVESKLVVINQPSNSKELSEFLADKLDDIPETTHLLVIEGALDKRTAYYKKISKHKSSVELKTKKGSELTVWVKDYAESNGLKLNNQLAQRLIERAGENQWRLASEVEKLAPLGDVSKEQIDELVEQDPSNTVFNMLDSLAAGKLQSSHQMYENLRKQQIDTNIILSMLAWQVQNIFLIVFAGDRPDQEIAKDAGINPFVVSKTRPLARKLGKTKVTSAVKILTDYEAKIKTGKIDADEGIKLAITKLAKLFA